MSLTPASRTLTLLFALAMTTSTRADEGHRTTNQDVTSPAPISRESGASTPSSGQDDVTSPSPVSRESGASTVSGEPSETAPSQTRRPFWRTLWSDHAAHVGLVLAAAFFDDGVTEQRGTRASPLFLSSPPSFDVSLRDRFRRGIGDYDAHGYLESHVTPVTRGIAAASILLVNGKAWRDDVDDILGLWEALRFNVATTGIVKNFVGRERPRLEFAEDDGLSPLQITRLQARESSRQSFYSFHASTAFTPLAYADLVLSRRLENHDAARRWTRSGLYTLAGYLAWARVLQDGHYATDVVTGSLAGIFIGRSFYAFNHHDGRDRWLSWDPRPRSRVTILPPVLTPDGIQVGVSVSFPTSTLPGR